MKFAIITHVLHTQSKNQYFGYAPYIREMNIWIKYVDEVIIIAPLTTGEPAVIDLDYKHNDINFIKVSAFSFTNFKTILSSIFKLPVIIRKIFTVMKNADHIHLRCPGNMGLIACFIQILFPKKLKTAKYAGNWDPKSQQPFSYKLQKWILNNTFLTRNMTVLIYGDWNNQSKNIKSFFTATYSESEKQIINKTSFDSAIEFIFVGSLVPGKNPLYAIKIIQHLKEKGYSVILNLYGEGSERKKIESYIQTDGLENFIILHGNQSKDMVEKAYKKSHFVILPSKSEGWPKAIAEGMFWGCVPIASKVSCVPYMLDYSKRGILLDMNLDNDVNNVKAIIRDEEEFFYKSKLAIEWSQKYTTDSFEVQVKRLLT